MNKVNMISKVSQATGIKNEDVKVIVDTFLQFIQEALAQGEEVNLKGFGRFFNKKRPDKVARNLNTNTTIIVPAHYAPALRISKDFTQKIKEAVPVN